MRIVLRKGPIDILQGNQTVDRTIQTRPECRHSARFLGHLFSHPHSRSIPHIILKGVYLDWSKGIVRGNVQQGKDDIAVAHKVSFFLGNSRKDSHTSVWNRTILLAHGCGCRYKRKDITEGEERCEERQNACASACQGRRQRRLTAKYMSHSSGADADDDAATGTIEKRQRTQSRTIQNVISVHCGAVCQELNIMNGIAAVKHSQERKTSRGGNFERHKVRPSVGMLIGIDLLPQEGRTSRRLRSSEELRMERSQKHKNTNCARHQLLTWHLSRHEDTTNLW